MNFIIKYRKSAIGYSSFFENICKQELNFFMELGNCTNELSQRKLKDHLEVTVRNKTVENNKRENIKIYDNRIRFVDKSIIYNNPVIIMEYFIYKRMINNSGYYKVLNLSKRSINYVYCRKAYSDERIIYLPNATILFEEDGYLQYYKGRCNGIEIIRS